MSVLCIVLCVVLCVVLWCEALLCCDACGSPAAFYSLLQPLLQHELTRAFLHSCSNPETHCPKGSGAASATVAGYYSIAAPTLFPEQFKYVEPLNNLCLHVLTLISLTLTNTDFPLLISS